MKLAQITTFVVMLSLLSAVKASEFDLFANDEGIIDAKMRRITKDGRDAD